MLSSSSSMPAEIHSSSAAPDGTWFMSKSFTDEGKEGEETKPGMDMVSSKLEELERETAMKAHKKGEEEKKVDFVGEKRFK